MATHSPPVPIQRATPAAAPATPAPTTAPPSPTFASRDRAAALGHRLDEIPVRRPSPPGAGAPLPASTRGTMEAAFGADFSAVRVHRSPRPAALGAAAFTQGDAIHITPDRYRPDTREGQKLLGHELTHVVQQRARRVSVPQASGASLVNADPRLEAEADTLGERAARGVPVAVHGVPGAGHGVQPKLLSGLAAPIQCGGACSSGVAYEVADDDDAPAHAGGGGGGGGGAAPPPAPVHVPAPLPANRFRHARNQQVQFRMGLGQVAMRQQDELPDIAE